MPQPAHDRFMEVVPFVIIVMSSDTSKAASCVLKEMFIMLIEAVCLKFDTAWHSLIVGVGDLYNLMWKSLVECKIWVYMAVFLAVGLETKITVFQEVLHNSHEIYISDILMKISTSHS
jgi:hypothetical protein